MPFAANDETAGTMNESSRMEPNRSAAKKTRGPIEDDRLPRNPALAGK